MHCLFLWSNKAWNTIRWLVIVFSTLINLNLSILRYIIRKVQWCLLLLLLKYCCCWLRLNWFVWWRTCIYFASYLLFSTFLWTFWKTTSTFFKCHDRITFWWMHLFSWTSLYWGTTLVHEFNASLNLLL